MSSGDDIRAKAGSASSPMQQNADGSWTEATPLPAYGWLRVENWFRRRGCSRIANAIARWDERGLKG